MSDFSVTEAFLNGWHSHKNGVDLSQNPHAGYSATRELYSLQQWALGHCSRCEPVKLGGDLTYDNVI
jgi:hypothetical protein